MWARLAKAIHWIGFLLAITILGSVIYLGTYENSILIFVAVTFVPCWLLKWIMTGDKSLLPF